MRIVFLRFLLILSPTLSTLVPSPTFGGEATKADEGASLEERFRAEYPAAAKRLEAATENLRVKAKVRHRTKTDRDADWTAFELYKTGKNVRYHTHYSESAKQASMGRVSSEVATLLTPELNAVVRDPSTEFAWAERQEKDLSVAMIVDADAKVWRFLKSLYCIDGVPLIDSINRISSPGHFLENTVALSHFVESKEHDGWVEARARFVLKNSSQPSFVAVGHGTICFSPAEDWAIRKVVASADPAASNPKSRQAFRSEISETIRLPGDKLFPKAFRQVVFFDPKTPPAGAGPARTLSRFGKL